MSESEDYSKDGEDNEDMEWRRGLADACGRVNCAGSFACCATYRCDLPNIMVQDVGMLPLPLQPHDISKLKSNGAPAPYGKGTATVLDPEVRRALQIEASRITLSPMWGETLKGLTVEALTALGVANIAGVEARLYKLLVYEQGGHFRVHRDTEKEPGMFATLIVQLPVVGGHEGGDLEVMHEGHKLVWESSKDSTRTSLGSAADKTDGKSTAPASTSSCNLQYAAFYADCEHSLLPITNGVRVVLAYNLVQTAMAVALPQLPHNAKAEQAVAGITVAVQNWMTALDAAPTPRMSSAKVPKSTNTATPSTAAAIARDTEGGADATAKACPALTAFPLEHQYTPTSLSFEGLKGRDAELVRLLQATGLLDVQLALVKREETFHLPAEGSYDEEETKDTEFSTHRWTAFAGTPVEFEMMVECKGKVVSALGGGKLLGRWTSTIPDNTEIEGYTGNDHTTEIHTYYKAVVVVWPRSHCVSMLTSLGPGMFRRAAALLSQRLQQIQHAADGGDHSNTPMAVAAASSHATAPHDTLGPCNPQLAEAVQAFSTLQSFMYFSLRRCPAECLPEAPNLNRQRDDPNFREVLTLEVLMQAAKYASTQADCGDNSQDGHASGGDRGMQSLNNLLRDTTAEVMTALGATKGILTVGIAQQLASAAMTMPCPSVLNALTKVVGQATLKGQVEQCIAVLEAEQLAPPRWKGLRVQLADTIVGSLLCLQGQPACERNVVDCSGDAAGHAQSNHFDFSKVADKLESAPAGASQHRVLEEEKAQHVVAFARLLFDGCGGLVPHQHYGEHMDRFVAAVLARKTDKYGTIERKGRSDKRTSTLEEVLQCLLQLPAVQRAAVGHICLQPLLLMRLQQLEAAVMKVPTFSWCMEPPPSWDSVKLDGNSRVEGFLRGSTQSATFSCFDNLQHASNWAFKHFGDLKHMLDRGYSAVAHIDTIPDGTGSAMESTASTPQKGSKYSCKVTKTRDMFNRKNAKYHSHAEELRWLRLLLKAADENCKQGVTV